MAEGAETRDALIGCSASTSWRGRSEEPRIYIPTGWSARRARGESHAVIGCPRGGGEYLKGRGGRVSRCIVHFAGPVEGQMLLSWWWVPTPSGPR